MPRGAHPRQNPGWFDRETGSCGGSHRGASSVRYPRRNTDTMLLTPFQIPPPTSVFVGVDLIVQQRGLLNPRTAERTIKWIGRKFHPG